MAQRATRAPVSHDAEVIAGCQHARDFGRALGVIRRDVTVRPWSGSYGYVWTHEGWLYLAAILDLYSRRVVGWAASACNDRALALDALARATSTRKPAAGLLHHSDRGSVYASGDYGDALAKIGAIKSMSRKGDC